MIGHHIYWKNFEDADPGSWSTFLKTAVDQATYLLPIISDTYQGFTATSLVRKVAVQATFRGPKNDAEEPRLDLTQLGAQGNPCFILVPFFCSGQAWENL